MYAALPRGYPLTMAEHNLGVTNMPRLILAGSHTDVAADPSRRL